MAANSFPDDESVMRRALELARRGEGWVEPNPAVGAVIVDGERRLLGEGWHQRYGGPHAEVEAIAQAGESTQGATLFVTLEPCAHHGKTPPCADAVVAAGIRRVVVAAADPAPHTSGQGFARLRDAGVLVETGLLCDEAERLIRPFATLMTEQRSYVIAKWAMTLDGCLATRTGHSKWISCAASRERVHQLRGRVDAIAAGIGTVLADDPLLTARPPGPRTPVRVVIDPRAETPVDSQLVKTAADLPTLVVTAESAAAEAVSSLQAAGVEVIAMPASTDSSRVDLAAVVQELGRRRLTNLLVEGGGGLLGRFRDAGLIDECHIFIAPKLVGGAGAVSPVGGFGLAEIPQAPNVIVRDVEAVEGDLYLRADVIRAPRQGRTEV